MWYLVVHVLPMELRWVGKNLSTAFSWNLNILISQKRSKFLLWYEEARRIFVLLHIYFWCMGCTVFIPTYMRSCSELPSLCGVMKKLSNVIYSQCHKGMQSLTALGVRTPLHQYSTTCRTAFQFHWLECVDECKYLPPTTLKEIRIDASLSANWNVKMLQNL
jgi:hypothetical protein